MPKVDGYVLVSYTTEVMDNASTKDYRVAANNRQQIARIKGLYLSGQISRELAKILAEPIIERINRKQLEVWVRFNKDPKKFRGESFIGLMR